MKSIIKLLFNKFIRIRKKSFVLKNAPKEFLDDLNSLSNSSVAIDLGANIGIVTELLAATGAKVYAFEPNREAFLNLYKSCKCYSNVEAFQIGAGVKYSLVELYLHENARNSNKDYSQASSLLANKSNISSQNKILIYEVDFCDFLNKINCCVDILKIDIEGYEIALINHLLDCKIIDKVKKVYVETHEVKTPSLYDATMMLKQRVESLGLSSKFVFTWH
jgi:FkbM family methyltransferase